MWGVKDKDVFDDVYHDWKQQAFYQQDQHQCQGDSKCCQKHGVNTVIKIKYMVNGCQFWI
jgi:hypothetical protein